MSKKAWTISELTVAIIIFTLLCAFGIKVFKPNYNKTKLFAYATLLNISKGNSAVMEKFGAIAGDNVGNIDNYCIKFSNQFSIKGEPNCDTLATDRNTKLSLVLSNGVTLYGLASDWKEPYDGAPFAVKNIAFDIDGDKGFNRVWVDRFPLRVYKGGRYSGAIQLVDCSNDTFYKADGTTQNKAVSPHCKDGVGFTGNAVTKGISATSNSSDVTKQNYIVTYDIYRVGQGDGLTAAELVETGLPPIEADCKAYAGQGFFSPHLCKTKTAYRMSPYCATDELCSKCMVEGTGGYNVCPTDLIDPTRERNIITCKDIGINENPKVDNVQASCFTVLHRPNVGAGLMFGNILNSINY